MATHSNILAWEISWTEERGRLQSMGAKRVVGHNLAAEQGQDIDLDHGTCWLMHLSESTCCS